MVDGYNIFMITIPGLSRLNDTDRAIIKDRIKRNFQGWYFIDDDQVFIKVCESITAKDIYSQITITDYTSIPMIIMKIDDTINEGIYGISHMDLWKKFFKYNPIEQK